MKVVNRVYKGYLWEPISFENLEKLCVNSKVSFKIFRGRPRMFKIRCDITILIFSNGRFRVMGLCTEESVEKTLQTLLHLYWWDYVLEFQTCTVTFQVDSIPPMFVEYAGNDVRYDGELFPSIHICKWTTVHANLFVSGKVVVLGRDAWLKAFEIRDWLNDVIGRMTLYKTCST